MISRNVAPCTAVIVPAWCLKSWKWTCHSPHGEMGWWLDRGWWEVAENVGVTNGDGVHALYGLHLAFIASPPHRDNMLNPAHRGIGLAVRQSSDGRFWVAQFYGGF